MQYRYDNLLVVRYDSRYGRITRGRILPTELHTQLTRKRIHSTLANQLAMLIAKVCYKIVTHTHDTQIERLSL